MQETTIYFDQVIPDDALARAFALATRSAPTSVIIINSPRVDGAVAAWGDPARPTVIRRWQIPGEFQFAMEVFFQQLDTGDEQATQAILRDVAREVNVALLSDHPDEYGAFVAMFPDGSEVVVEEDLSVADPAVVLTTGSRKVYEATRSIGDLVVATP